MRKRAIKSLLRLIRTTVGEPCMGCEVGVWRGGTARALLQTFPWLTLFAVDPWHRGGDHETLRASLEELKAAEQEFLKVTEFAALRRCTLPLPSVEAADMVTDGTFDFVFIDAEHLYETVGQDLRGWAPKVRAGGLLCGHDYAAPHDKRGIFGVKRAVDEYAAEVGREVNLADGDIWWWVKEWFGGLCLSS